MGNFLVTSGIQSSGPALSDGVASQELIFRGDLNDGGVATGQVNGGTGVRQGYCLLTLSSGLALLCALR